jgi:2-C-methyl-D-erythritol 4-phosphate cytidylyltransferase
MSTFLIIPAAGSGSRLARPEPKALVPLAGRPMLSWTLDALAEVAFQQIVVAVPPDRKADFERLLEGRASIVAGGETRSASVRAGFYSLRWTGGDVVGIHDAARPFVTGSEVASVIGEAERSGAAIAATPIVDTIKKVKEGRVLGTLDRSGLFAAGTPQAFRADLLADILASGRESTDEAGLFELAGLPVCAVSVSRFGFKITHPVDLEMAEALLKRRLKVD